MFMLRMNIPASSLSHANNLSIYGPGYCSSIRKNEPNNNLMAVKVNNKRFKLTDYRSEEEWRNAINDYAGINNDKCA